MGRLGKAQSALRGAIATRCATRVLGSRLINAHALRKLAFNCEYDIGYSRIQKNANSTTIVLMDSLSGKDVGVNASKKSITRIRSMDIKTIRRLAEFQYFVVVRNPYSRTLSAFLQKFPKERYRNEYGKFQLDIDGFRAFVRWLDNGGSAKNSHWAPQLAQMCFKLSDYDAVIKIENYNAEMREFLTQVGVPESKIDIAKSSASGSFHQTGASSKLMQFYDRETIEIVKRVFESDFKTLGYDPDRLL